MRVVSIILFVLFSAFSFAQNTKTESPFLQVLTGDAIIPLQKSTADVQIVGRIAHVKITQVYENLSKQAIEAKYIFPMSTKAAVHDMNMQIGNRIVKATIYEKEKAKKVYNKAIKQGKRASKLDQKRPNVFQMKVGNIMPNDKITITIYYTELVTQISGQYQFVYPGVVGPRYTGENTSKEKTFHQPYLKNKLKSNFEYGINMCINGGMIIQDIHSKTHDINVQYPDATSAEIFLSKTNTNPSNRDFIVNYSLRGSSIQTGLLLYEGEKENFFSLMIEPPKHFKAKEITPREYLFVLDVSGSMMGYPIDVAKSLLKNLLANLNDNDAFNILLFSADNKVFKDKAVNVSEESLKEAIQFLTGKFNNYGKGTRLLKALQKGYTMARINEGSARTMVIITDGYVSVEKEAFDLIENNLDKANVVTFGIGSSVNRYLLEGMSKVGKSEFFLATNKNEAYKVAKDFKKYIASPLLTQINIETYGFDIYDVEPKTIPDVFSERPIMIYGKYNGKAKGTIRISGYQGKTFTSKVYQVKNGRLSQDNKALKYLWARKRIERLVDYKKVFGNDVKQEVVKLGLQYNLATEFTSFVAVDQEIVNKNGKTQKVKQPLTLPNKIENIAVGAEASVKGKSIPKKSLKIEFENTIESSEKRRLKIWLIGSYANTIKTYLKNCAQIKIHFNARGEIVKIEKEIDGVWFTDLSLKTKFKKLPFNLSSKEIKIIIHQ